MKERRRTRCGQGEISAFVGAQPTEGTSNDVSMFVKAA